MEKEEQVGGDIYNTEKEAASEKTQEIRKSGDEPTDCQTGGKVADKVGRFARERKTGREASKRGIDQATQIGYKEGERTACGLYSTTTGGRESA